MNVFHGISASDGIGTGKAFVIPSAGKRIIPQKTITPSEIAAGWQRFERAVQTISSQIQKRMDAVKDDRVQREIFETYIIMLSDPVFIAEVKKSYETDLYNIEYVLNTKIQEYADRLRQSGNEYLEERAKDIWDIFGQVLDELLDFHPFDINQVPDGVVIVAQAMNPSDTIILSKQKIAGLALTEGGISSHVTILARNYGIPLVFSLQNIISKIAQGEQVIVDGENGTVIASPDPEIAQEYTARIQAEENHRNALKKFRDLPCCTKDGTRFTMLANIGTPEEAETALREGADGIGLFRTEFLFMSTTHPHQESADGSFSEESQFRAYKKVLEIMKDKPVTIRTLDAGGDKLIDSVEIPTLEEKNPLMGLRAVRLSLAYPQLFKIQLRALYRASVYGNLKIMLPLISSTDQVKQCRRLAQEVRDELTAEGIPFNKDVPIGIMVETAASAITADCLARVSDFFSLGTNDLTQYTVGIDRENPAVAHLYNEFHLAVLRLIQTVLTCATEAGIPVSVCGEMASRQDSALVLAGMGIRSLSVSPKQICMVKELLSRFTIHELQAISSKQLNNL